MISRILKQNNPLVFVFFFLLATLLFFRNIYWGGEQTIHPVYNSMPLYNLVVDLLKSSGINVFPAILVLVLFLTHILLITRLDFKFNLIETRSYLPAVLLLFIAGSNPSSYALHPLFFADLFLFWAITRIFESYRKEKAVSNFYDAGFLIGLASLFEIKLILLVLFVFIAIIIISHGDWRVWAGTLFGVLTVWLLFYLILFVVGLPFHFPFDGFISFKNDFLLTFTENYLNTYSFFALIILFILALFFVLRDLGMLNVHLRMYFKIIIWLALFLLLIIFTTLSDYNIFILPLSVPISLIITYFIVNLNSKLLSDLFLLAIILIFCLNYFHLHFYKIF